MSLLPQSGISQPQFLPVHQLVEVLEGSTAVLDCRLANLATHHTVGRTNVLLHFDLQKVSLKTLFKRQGDKNHNLKNIDVSGVLDEVLRHVSADLRRSGVQL